MADETTTPAPLEDPYPDGVGGMVPTASEGPSAPSESGMARDPAVKLEPPPDPGEAFLTGRRADGSQMGPNEMVMAGIGRILDQQAMIMDLIKEGANF